MKKELLEKINLANKEIKKVISFIEENELAFGYMDLKLHDASYYFYSQMEKDFPLLKHSDDRHSYFNNICNDEYNFCVEDLDNNYDINFDEMHHQLGRTSSFYLHDKRVINITVNGLKYKDTIYNLIDNYYGGELEFLDNCMIDIEQTIELLDNEYWYEEDVENELDYIINELYGDLLDYSKDIFTTYNYIKEFKDNQVEIFKTHLEFYQEEKECELEYISA